MKSRESLQGKAYGLSSLEKWSKPLWGSFMTYEEHFKDKKTLITPVRNKYEWYNDVLEEAIEEVEQEQLEGVNDNEGEDINERQAFTMDADDYGFFYPDRPQEHRQYDIRYDMGLNVKICNRSGLFMWYNAG